MKTLLIFIYGLLVLLPVTVVALKNPTGLTAYSLAQYAGLIGGPMLFLQLTLAARYRWIERWIGLDKLMRWHKLTGIAGISFALLHPILFSVYYQQFGTEVHLAFLMPGWKWETLGMVSLDFMTILVGLALFNRWLKLPYHWWKRIHQFLYLGALGGFIHSLFLGSDLVAGPLRWYWLALGFSGIFAFIYRRVIRKYHYKVVAISNPAPLVYHVTLEPTHNQHLQHAPGQFAFVQFQAKGITKEWHPFTISSSPTDQNLTFSMKASGDWTKTLNQLQVGALVKLEGPYGRFNYAELPVNAPLVFIAGGIGITPLRSMIRTLVANKDKRAITLLYNTKTEADLAFKQEFDGMPITVNYIANRYITLDDLKATMQIPDTHYFVCGPPAMMDATLKQLQTLGVSPHVMHTERFALK